MPIQIAGARSIGRVPGTARRTVLLTGASGVVGRALLRLTPPAILDAADLGWLARALTSAARHLYHVMPATG
jgi:hypothetical protein